MGEITGYIDTAQVVLYVFWAFFAGLIFYLRREDRREGYPLVSEGPGRRNPGVVWIPAPKVFKLPHGGTALAPDAASRKDTRELKATATAPWSGAPLEPTGDPMLAAVGPGAYADRADVPDMTHDGLPKIVPLRVATQFAPSPGEPDPRGMDVVTADGVVAGKVRDIWVDRSETIIRYLEVVVAGTAGEPRIALLPMPFAKVDGNRRVVKVKSILARHLPTVPGLKSPDQVTLLEEDRISAYYGAGHLYALPQRMGPVL